MARARTWTAEEDRRAAMWLEVACGRTGRGARRVLCRAEWLARGGRPGDSRRDWTEREDASMMRALCTVAGAIGRSELAVVRRLEHLISRCPSAGRGGDRKEGLGAARGCVPVVCVETGAEFQSISSAARAAGVSVGAMYAATVSARACAGCHWWRLEPVRERRGGSALKRRILRELEERGGAGGGATLSVAEIAASVGASELMVRRSLRALRRAGVVASEPRFGASGAQTGNCYRITDAPGEPVG